MLEFVRVYWSLFEEEGGVGEGEGEEWSRSLEKLMLEKKNENWEMLKKEWKGQW